MELWGRRSNGQKRSSGDEATPKKKFSSNSFPFARRSNACCRRRDKPYATRKQQCLLSGQRDLMDQLGHGGRGASGIYAEAHRFQEKPSGLLQTEMVSRPAHQRGGRRRHRMVSAVHHYLVPWLMGLAPVDHTMNCVQDGIPDFPIFFRW